MTQHTAASSEGSVVRDARGYDRQVWRITLGRARQLRVRMANLIPLKIGDTVLDVGCGTGDLTLELATRVGSSGTVVGIDASPQMIARAREKSVRRRLPVEFHVARAEEISFAERSFDYVVSSLVFHALPGAIKREALGGVARVLSEGGQLVIVDFLDQTGHILTHAARHADPHDLPTLLRSAGFEPAQSGRIPFFTVGAPPLGYIRAELSRRSPGQ